jgi:Homeodomain-like domain
MNKLPLAKRIQILAMLCEGWSMRSISRMAAVSINTVSKLLVDAGKACAAFHEETVRGVKAQSSGWAPRRPAYWRNAVLNRPRDAGWSESAADARDRY